MVFGLGTAAALGTALSWSFASIINATSSRLLGVYNYLMMRQLLATVVLAVACLFAGQLAGYPGYALTMAFISGLTGLVLCDWCLYEGMMRIGIRPAAVCHSLYSCCTALFGVIFLQEYLGVQGIVGILLATLGVIVVILSERRYAHSLAASPREQRIGVALSLLSAVLMALGMIFSKEALKQDMPPLMLAFLRNLSGFLILWTLALATGRIRRAFGEVRAHPQVWKLLPLGCAVGPTGGIWLSCVALAYLPAAVASTLIGLQPIVLLFLTGMIERRSPAAFSIMGAIAACGGAALVLLR